MTYDNTNRWSLFDNERKAKDTDADFTGTLNVNGVEYFINGWRPKQGSKLKLSGTIKLKNTKAGEKPKPAEDYRGNGGSFSGGGSDFDHDIPFASAHNFTN